MRADGTRYCAAEYLVRQQWSEVVAATCHRYPSNSVHAPGIA